MRLRGTRMDFSDSQEINHMKIVAGYGKQQQHITEVKLQGIGNTSLNSVPTKLPARGLRLETKCKNKQVKQLGAFYVSQMGPAIIGPLAELKATSKSYVYMVTVYLPKRKLHLSTSLFGGLSNGDINVSV